jgi:purine-nucleoside phosphorylase
MKKQFPILEHDPQQKAIIEPSEHFKPLDVADHCVICFFKEVIEEVCRTAGARIVFEDPWEDGMQQVFELTQDNKKVAFCHPGIGAPRAAAVLEEAIAIGCRKFIVCGGAGVLDRKIDFGAIVIPTAAVRDEGTSYHYLPPGREVEADPDCVQAIEQTLKSHNISYIMSKTWTTDGIFRETPEKIKMRRSEGCLTVEMEAAAFFAVAQFRGVKLAQMLYGGDDVSGDTWDMRGELSRKPFREKLFWLAVEACLSM